MLVVRRVRFWHTNRLEVVIYSEQEGVQEMLSYGVIIYTYVALVVVLVLWSAYGYTPQRMGTMAARLHARRHHAQQQSLGSLQAERWQY